jgi:hypothetical protein
MKNQIESQFFLPVFRSGLATFLCGTQVNPLEIKNVPPILACKFLPSPGQQERLSLRDISIFPHLSWLR